MIGREFCIGQIAFILDKIDKNLEQFSDKFPAPASKGNIYPAIENTDWTSSFWTGMLWLAYEVTGDVKYRKAAEKQLESYKERLDKRDHTDTHDLGFLYTLSCVAAYRLTGDEEARNTALKAADMLMERYYEKAGIIQAWGDLRDPGRRGRMIIDCCMNLQLSLNYTTKNFKQSNGLLLQAVYSKPAGDGVDECNIWGDYFYFEALVRLVKDWKPYW